MRLTLIAGAVAAAIVSVALFVLPRLYAGEFAQPFMPAATAWATSKSCGACHQDHHASWFRTFHRTMTQEATTEAVRGEFDGTIYRYWGVGVRPVQRNGAFFFEYLDADDRVTLTLPVLRTVGSRRYQQYLVQTPNGGETYYRVHLLWHMEDERWMHVNGVFLRPDEQGFDDRVAVWNHNCIFCHNTGPVPNVRNMEDLKRRELAGERVNSALEAQYDSSVAELGIACETCHGPGAEHAQRNRNPLRRYALHLSGSADPTITHPRHLDQQRSVDICGQCHGQRTPLTPAALRQWIDTGPTFRAGERLADHVRPVFRDIEVPGGINPDLFRLRFWPDETPRLTAYEYQGLLQSKCFDGGEITCISCHTLHDGDVRGNISERNRGNAPCLECHTQIAADISAHTKHEEQASGSLCYACHMPKMVFGVMDIHRSHRIEVPRPAQDALNDRPNACTHCHLGESVGWAQRELDSLWHGRPPRASAPNPVSHLLESLHAGDPVQRAVAARLAGREDAAGDPRERVWLIPHLLRALEDNYPSTRNLARKSLLQLDQQLHDVGVATGVAEALLDYDFIGDPARRATLIRAAWRAWSGFDKTALPTPPAGGLLDARWMPVEPQTSALIARGHSHTKQIAIGE